MPALPIVDWSTAEVRWVDGRYHFWVHLRPHWGERYLDQFEDLMSDELYADFPGVSVEIEPGEPPVVELVTDEHPAEVLAPKLFASKIEALARRTYETVTAAIESERDGERRVWVNDLRMAE